MKGFSTVNDRDVIVPLAPSSPVEKELAKPLPKSPVTF